MCQILCHATWIWLQPWSLQGGCEGSPNYAEVLRAGGTVETYAVITALEVNEDDVIRIHTGNGGGYGDPRRRPRAKILEDLGNGLLTPERARTVHEIET